MLEIRIYVRLDTDLFGQIRILKNYGSLQYETRCRIAESQYEPRIQIGIRVVAKSAGSENLTLISTKIVLDPHYCGSVRSMGLLDVTVCLIKERTRN
jgi:hypothetical protein